MPFMPRAQPASPPLLKPPASNNWCMSRPSGPMRARIAFMPKPRPKVKRPS
jgi:hypothetical protein